MRGEFVDLGGVRLYCYAFGERGGGAPLVLIHGAFTSSHLWQDVLPRLPKGHRSSALAASRGDTAAALAPGGIACPVLLATAAADPFVPTARAIKLGETLRLAAPNGIALHELPGVAHVAPEEAPDQLGALVAELLTHCIVTESAPRPPLPPARFS